MATAAINFIYHKADRRGKNLPCGELLRPVTDRIFSVGKEKNCISISEYFPGVEVELSVSRGRLGWRW